MKAKTIANTELNTFLESDDYSTIVQKNTDRYKKKWEKWATKKAEINLDTTCSWNWAGFFFQEIWLLYRKMTNVFWVCLGLRLIVTAIALIIPSLNSVVDMALLGLAVTCGMYGNTWYLKKCINLAQNAQAKFTHIEDSPNQETQRKEFLNAKGGVYIKGVLIYLSVMLVCFAVLFAILFYKYENASIARVQTGVFEIDNTRYLSEALEGYTYFKNPQWKEVTTSQGRKLIRFSAEYDFIQEAKDLNQIDFYKEFPSSSVLFVMDFALDSNNSAYFNIYAWSLIINGQSYMDGDGDFAYDILSNVIYPNKFLNIPIYIEMRSGN